MTLRQERYPLNVLDSRKPWARHFPCCRKCGTTTRKHAGKGLCEPCAYALERIRRNVRPQPKRRAGSLSGSDLYRAYVEKRQSCAEIATELGCSRGAVYSQLKAHGIPIRSLHEARIVALHAGRVPRTSRDENGAFSESTLTRVVVNERFFRVWTPAMAWVLGLLATDGCMTARPNAAEDRPFGLDHIRLGMKDRDVLEKALAAMESDAQIVFRPERKTRHGLAGALSHFELSHPEILSDLFRLGITPRKSLTLEFPAVPDDLASHFIRGCWDGDGSVYLSGVAAKIHASFVTGSRDFVTALLARLYRAGLPKRTLYTQGNVFYFRYHGADCAALYAYLYRDAPHSICLERKRSVFEGWLARQPRRSDSAEPIDPPGSERI